MQGLRIARAWAGAVSLAVGLCAEPAHAADTTIRISKPAELREIPLRNAPVEDTEIWDSWQGQTIVRNVVRPTVTPVLPTREKQTGIAVVVIPGSGHCDRLTGSFCSGAWLPASRRSRADSLRA
ncbi:hypothetical protein [Novosphingobium olei]|uniref:Uncharacterized protein n=1 Tax=Novosphingobium olei TaxID=2728851 RepID=A0A7Y0GAA0_9SPHN|nr:hypothetical protein [Novosphingobium olei]NML93878.1 hypothetical protein [Novosphingobium olei]